MAKVKCIIKRTDEKRGHMTAISTSLKNLQKTVGGNIECVTIGWNPRFVVICNEDGKLLGLQKNFKLGYYDIIVGDAIIIGVDGDDFCDIPITFDTWKKLLADWGNEI